MLSSADNTGFRGADLEAEAVVSGFEDMTAVGETIE